MSSKFLLIVVMSLLLLSSCGKTSTDTLNEMTSSEAISKSGGSFKGYGSEKVNGQAKIYLTGSKYMLKLENFSSSNGLTLKCICLKRLLRRNLFHWAI